MYHYNHMFYEPEPEFSNYETYHYLTSFGSSYGSVGPHGEPRHYHQEELRDESHFYSMQDEEDDGFLSRAWYSNGLNQQGYDTTESLYNDTGTWLDGCESYFAICWGGDLLPNGYSYSGYEANSGPEKADTANSDGACYSFSQDMQPPAHNDDQWLVSGFEFAFNEDYHDHGGEKHDTEGDDKWNETRLWESIFGHWPCLVRVDHDGQAALTHQ